MKLEEITSLWEQDSKIDKTELAEESLKIPQLHHKYYKIYSNEKLILRKLNTEYKQLRLEKYEFYTQGPNEETDNKGWKLPASGRILKADVLQYIEADTDLINLSLKIGIQEEKIEFLESIIKTLNNRGYNIHTALEFIKFMNGLS
jgi:hypothetical protein